MKEQSRNKRGFVPVLGTAVVALVGLTIALGLVEVLMRTFPTGSHLR